MNIIRRYRAINGQEVITDWLADLRDVRARARIVARINRLKAGNFGDCKTLQNGVSELRIDYGPGYRVYFSRVGKLIILLLCGGDKRTQVTDIQRAIDYLDDFKRRERHEIN